MPPTPRTRACALALATLAAALPACSKGLSGTYVKCYAINASSSRLATVAFPSSGGFSYKLQSYTATLCTGTATTQIDGTGTYTEDSSTVDGASNINFAFTSTGLSGTTIYQIYKLDGATLFLGDSEGSYDGSSADKRPTALESAPFSKQ